MPEDGFSRLVWTFPGAVIVWIYFAITGKRHPFRVFINDENTKYNVLFSLSFYTIVIGLIIIFTYSA